VIRLSSLLFVRRMLAMIPFTHGKLMFAIEVVVARVDEVGKSSEIVGRLGAGRGGCRPEIR
jgi:hypothetical protein